MLTYIAFIVVVVVAFPVINVKLLSLYWKAKDRRMAPKAIQVDWKNEFKQ